MVTRIACSIEPPSDDKVSTVRTVVAFLRRICHTSSLCADEDECTHRNVLDEIGECVQDFHAFAVIGRYAAALMLSHALRRRVDPNCQTDPSTLRLSMHVQDPGRMSTKVSSQICKFGPPCMVDRKFLLGSMINREFGRMTRFVRPSMGKTCKTSVEPL